MGLEWVVVGSKCDPLGGFPAALRGRTDVWMDALLDGVFVQRLALWSCPASCSN